MKIKRRFQKKDFIVTLSIEELKEELIVEIEAENGDHIEDAMPSFFQYRYHVSPNFHDYYELSHQKFIKERYQHRESVYSNEIKGKIETIIFNPYKNQKTVCVKHYKKRKEVEEEISIFLLVELQTYSASKELMTMILGDDGDKELHRVTFYERHNTSIIEMLDGVVIKKDVSPKGICYATIKISKENARELRRHRDIKDVELL